MPIVISCLKDNYTYLITWGNNSLVVDPAEARSVFQALDNQNLSYILITHHHADHVGGNLEIKAKTRALIIGTDSRIPGIDKTLTPPQTLNIGPYQIDIIPTPGHTQTHVAYHFPKEKWLFCGDTLFAGGCGRIFEGTVEQMFSSLQALAALPDDTKAYCGHEYTKNNLEFALSVEPDQLAVKKKLRDIQNQKVTIPSTIGEEKATNPFLRTNDPNLTARLNLDSPTEVEVFAALRELKDEY